MNKIILTGNLVKDVELKVTESGVHWAQFTIAVNRTHSDANGERKTDFFDCIAWRKTAETLTTYCTKGSKVMVVGELQTEKWTDKYMNNRTAYKVNVSEFELLGGKNGQTANDGATSQDKYKDENLPPKKAFNDDQNDNWQDRLPF